MHMYVSPAKSKTRHFIKFLQQILKVYENSYVFTESYRIFNIVIGENHEPTIIVFLFVFEESEFQSARTFDTLLIGI